MNTPWGASDYQKQVAAGIVFVATPSHGGYFLSPEMLAKVPAAWRKVSFNGQGARGWFEEDCDWCMVALTLPDAFPTEAQAAARQTFDGLIAPKLVKMAHPADLG